ncbi:hypothetical protein TRSC58_07312 [Trypanosoma rangeli SC58]|uniref:Uncharacterized protein n=1 Tax=Trypanosoma rangeli SC58 TaxID=429131 RepID=A0A061IRP9_TRYRA|nr:hypothetical protein TRSC58_07312 [Trypanosoma rangeli SC58]
MPQIRHASVPYLIQTPVLDSHGGNLLGAQLPSPLFVVPVADSEVLEGDLQGLQHCAHVLSLECSPALQHRVWIGVDAVKHLKRQINLLTRCPSRHDREYRDQLPKADDAAVVLVEGGKKHFMQNGAFGPPEKRYWSKKDQSQCCEKAPRSTPALWRTGRDKNAGTTYVAPRADSACCWLARQPPRV